MSTIKNEKNLDSNPLNKAQPSITEVSFFEPDGRGYIPIKTNTNRRSIKTVDKSDNNSLKGKDTFVHGKPKLNGDEPELIGCADVGVINEAPILNGDTSEKVEGTENNHPPGKICCTIL